MLPASSGEPASDPSRKGSPEWTSGLNRPPNHSLFWLLQCGGWLAFGVAMYGWGLNYFSPRDALVNKTLLVLTGFCLTLGLRRLYRSARGKRLSPLHSALLLMVTSFAGAAIWREAHTLLFQAFLSTSATGKMSVGLVGIPLGTLLYDGFVVLAWSLLYCGINDWVELEKQRQRAARAEAMAQAARLRALQSQLEPHFLFNTLNAVSTLISEGENAAAVGMIARLSDFLRLTLETGDTPEISVAEELEFVRRYLEIEQVRFGDRLQVAIEAQPGAMPALVPALVLQPLVENAVKHGVLPSERGGCVSVKITRNDGALRLSVADDGPGLAASGTVAEGTGVRNTRARLAELYGNASQFSIERSSGGGVTATIEIPFRAAGSIAGERGASV